MSFYCFILILFVRFTVSLCCSCKQLNVSESFCKSNFVAHVKIVNVTCANLSDPHQDLEYGVEYIQFYKKNPTFSTVKYKNVIHTGRHKGVCGVEFDIHSTSPNETDWIVFGNVCHKEAYTSTCSATSRFNNDTVQRLRGSLKFNCTGPVDVEVEKPGEFESTTNVPTKSPTTAADSSVNGQLHEHLSEIENFFLLAMSYQDILYSEGFPRQLENLYLL